MYIDDIFFLWEHGEEKLRSYRIIEYLNEKHPTIKFTAVWSKTSINFLDVTVSLIGGKVTTYYCKKGIPYSQALRLDRICSDPNLFRCNDLEK